MALKEENNPANNLIELEQAVSMGFISKEEAEEYKQKDKLATKINQEFSYISETFRSELISSLEPLIKGKNLEDWLNEKSEGCKKEIKKYLEELNKNPDFNLVVDGSDLGLRLPPKKESSDKNHHFSWGINRDNNSSSQSPDEIRWIEYYLLPCDDGKIIKTCHHFENNENKGVEVEILGEADKLEYILYYDFLLTKKKIKGPFKKPIMALPESAFL